MNSNFAISAWKVAIPILVAAALGLGGWALGATTSHGERLAVVETRAEASKEAALQFRLDLKETLTEIKDEISGLRDDLNQTKPHGYGRGRSPR